MHKACRYFICSLLLMLSHIAYANVVVIAPNTIVDKDVQYVDCVIDLSHGSFVVSNDATLVIKNCKIKGVVSLDNPNLILVTNGKLILTNNVFTISTLGIAPNPTLPSLYYAIKFMQGEAKIVDNRFSIDKAYTVGLFTTDKIPTRQIKFKRNTIANMHGGILLRNSRGAQITENKFTRVSSSNIFILEGGDHTVEGNTIEFPGNNNVGDGIDVSDAENVTLSNNYIAAGSCYSLVIYQCKDILIDNNVIVSGITYAIYITATDNLSTLYHDFYTRLRDKTIWNYTKNQNITVQNNYFSQNRYGLAANHVDGIAVRNNVFVQHFRDRFSRKFWTNNDILLQAVSRVDWHDNLYKESYAQTVNSDNRSASSFVNFPEHGGVVLE